MLSSQKYVIVNRTVKNNSQYSLETEEVIFLFEDKIITASDHFHINEVLDISFKLLSGTVGFLYLHTIKGLYSYVVKSEPHQFIDAYKQLMESN